MTTRRWTDERLVQAVKDNVSIRGVLQQLGLRATGGNYKTIYINVERLNLDITHWTGMSHNKGKTWEHISKIPLEKILISNSTYTSTNRLKKRLIKEKYLENICCECGTEPIWKDKPLVMVLDHINGNNRDNRINNLRLLCPNCNSQQSTFAGKNIKVDKKEYLCRGCGKKISRTTKSELCIKCSQNKRRKINVIRINDKILYKKECMVCKKEFLSKHRTAKCCSSECSHKKQQKFVVTKDELEKLVDEMPMIKIAERFGVSDQAIRKRCVKFGIDYKKKLGYWLSKK